MSDIDDEHGGAADRPQDRYVERLRPDPSQPPQRVLVLAGLLGDSDRHGFRRLYFTRDLTYYAEFLVDDVVDVTDVPAEHPPFVGERATRVTLRRQATIEYTRVRHARPLDEFDLDVRLGSFGRSARAAAEDTQDLQCNPPTADLECVDTWGCGTAPTCRCGDTVQITICRGRNCPFTDVNTCRTDCGQATCETCETQCDQPTCTPTCAPTCATCQTQCGQGTCQTCAGQATCDPTCATCETQCGQPTCETCPGQATCATCDTCNVRVFTCGRGAGCA